MEKAHLLLGFVFVFLSAFAVVVRLLVILPGRKLSNKSSPKSHASLMVLLGSGGHTGEMLRLLKDVEFDKYHQRTWVHYPEDSISIEKALKFDEARSQGNGKCVTREVKRARKVGQGWGSTIFSSISSLASCVSIVCDCPDVLICNGPGTSVMLSLAAFVLKFFGLSHTRIIFIESLARVHNLSLSGILLLPVADRFIVQWPEVAAKYRRAEYYNVLV